MCRVLKCSILDLTEEKETLNPASSSMDLPWDFDLYHKVITAVFKSATALDTKSSQQTLFRVIEQVYRYNLRYGKKDVDPHFVDWTLEQEQNNVLKQ